MDTTSANNYTSLDNAATKKINVSLMRKYINSTNIANDLDQSRLTHIGKNVIELATEDDRTRQEWLDKYNEALKIAKQTIEIKQYPFEKASNVKIPLILQGCIQTNARLMPELIQNNKTVVVSVIGTPTGEMEASAKRVSDHMSLQTTTTIDNWVTDTDKLMMALPLVGTVFRKWCYDPIMRRPSTFLCLPTEVIVNNNVTSLSAAPRITHLIKMSRNEIIERMRYGIYSDVTLNLLQSMSGESDNASNDDDRKLPSDIEDTATEYVVYEQCCYLDLDEDGYEEPYIVTVLKNTGAVLRIVARFDEPSFITDKKGTVIKIVPHEYYAAHHFLPSTDGTFLGVGFGSILLQLNSAINSITNNLIDAGSLANLRSGFVSDSLRIPKGDLNFTIGEFKEVKSPTGQNIANSVFVLPIQEPSGTLFSLLEFLVNFGRQIANISDVLMGNAASAKDIPATSVVTMVEQGSKIYSSILMRLYTSFKQEYKILFDLNRRYLPYYAEADLMIQDGFVTAEDYANSKYNVFPVANPALGMQSLKLSKLQFLLQMAQTDPTLNKREIMRQLFEAMGISDIDKIFKSDEELQAMNQPTPEMLKIQSETELNKVKAMAEQAKIMMAHEQEAFSAELREKEIQVDAAYKGADIAIKKALASAEIVFKNAQIGQLGMQKMEQAASFVEKEQANSKIDVDFSAMNKQLGLTEGASPDNMQQQGGEQGQPAEMQQGQAPQQAGNAGVPELPPELAAQLQEVAQAQKESE